MPTILVADDEPDIRTLIAFRLGRDGYQTLQAEDGHHALRMAVEQKPDLILMDIMMPNMDGFDALKALKEGEATRGIPVIVLTAKSDYPSVLQGWNLEAENYITKPFDMDELARIVGETLRYRKTSASYEI